MERPRSGPGAGNTGCGAGPTHNLDEGADDGQEYPGTRPRRQGSPKFLRFRREDHTADAAGPCPFDPHQRMTAQAVYRLLCDAPHCLAAELVDDLTQVPDGWRKLKSTDHITAPPPRPYSGGRRRPRGLTYSEQCRGLFVLHLCPQHTDVFDAHLPRTDGVYTRPGATTQARVSCSCGLNFGQCITSLRVASADMSGPDAYTEKLWWKHLPVELQWYAARDTEQVNR